MVEQPRPLPDEGIDPEGEWQDLINSIEATDIPLEMLKILRVHMDDGRRYVFPIKDWIADGASMTKIQQTVDAWYRDNDPNILGSDFIVDLDKLKNTVTAETKRILKLP